MGLRIRFYRDSSSAFSLLAGKLLAAYMQIFLMGLNGGKKDKRTK